MKYDTFIKQSNELLDELSEYCDPDFKHNDYIQGVLKQRYFKKKEDGSTENWYDLCLRVANCATQHYPEDRRRDIRDIYLKMLYRRVFLPNTPALINAKEGGGMISACFRLPIRDSLRGEGSIGDTLERSMTIFAKGGGAGYNFSELRPKGALIKSTGKHSTGVIPFMGMYNAMCEAIQQGGVRRGAMMAMLDIDHLDIKDFIMCKRNPEELTNFNISAIIPDWFFEKLSATENEDTQGKATYDTETANEIFDLLCESAWLNGEPGIYYDTTVQKQNPYPEDGKLSGNPCLAEDTLMLCGETLFPIKYGDTEVYKAWPTGNKPTCEISLSNGRTICLTEDHKVLTTEGWTAAKDLMGCRVIENADTNISSTKIDDEEMIRGFLFGDSYTCGSGYGIGVRINQDKEPEIYKRLLKYGLAPTKNNASCLYANKHNIMHYHHDGCKTKQLPYEILQCADPNIIASFLRGLFEANGTVLGPRQQRRVSYKTISKQLAKEIQNVLVIFGIRSYIVVNPPKKVKFDNGEYACREAYEIAIANSLSLSRFEKFIGFVSAHKVDNLRNRNKPKSLRNNWPKVISIKDTGIKKVWDFSMLDGSAKNSANGIIVHNCAEATLAENESCNLASINLKALCGAKGIRLDLLSSAVHCGVKFLNDLLVNNIFPDDTTKEATLRKRKIGLGLCGWHDALIISKIRYDSEEALNAAEIVAKVMKEAAIEMSHSLLDDDIEYMNMYSTHYGHALPILKIDGKETLNGCVLSIAPTGTLAYLLDTSHSIEPIFANRYKRKDVVDKDKLHSITHTLYKQYGNNPEYAEFFIEANDIAPEWHIKMVAAFQKHVDQGISKTISLPSTATIEDVKNIFLLGWKLGCKALTVYRDNTRDNVLKKEECSPEIAVLPAKVARIRGGCGKICVTLSHDACGRPRDIFINLGKGGGCANAWSEAVGRLCSQVLQLNGSLKENIISQLQGIRCPESVFTQQGLVTSCSDGIAKALEHIAETEPEAPVDQSHIINARLCPECGSSDYGKKGGCDVCNACGFSRCG